MNETETNGQIVGSIIILGVIGLAMVGTYTIGTKIGTSLRKIRKGY